MKVGLRIVLDREAPGETIDTPRKTTSSPVVAVSVELGSSLIAGVRGMSITKKEVGDDRPRGIDPTTDLEDREVTTEEKIAPRRPSIRCGNSDTV